MYVIFFILFFSSSAFAQVENYVRASADTLANELASLKTSAERFSAVNATLSAQNAQLQSRLAPVSSQLEKLAEENAALTRAALKLQDADPARARKIAELEKTHFELDNQLDRFNEEIRKTKAAIDLAVSEDETLNKKLKELGLAEPAVWESPVFEDSEEGRAKEKLWLLKVIDESKQRQQQLYSKIAQSKPSSSNKAQVSADKQALRNQIAVLQEQVDALARGNAQPVDTEQQLQELQAQVKALQKNHDELENLVARMQQKVKKTPLTGDQRNEERRLRGTLADLGKETRRLTDQLNALRRQMIGLDKQKAALEHGLKSTY